MSAGASFSIPALLRAPLLRTALLLERLTTGVDLYLFDAGFQRDPYRKYTQLRQRDPVHWSPIARSWVITRYGDVARVLRDDRFRAERRLERGRSRSRLGPPVDGDLGHWLHHSLLGADGARHARLRARLDGWFGRQRMEALTPRLEALVEAQLDSAGASFDVIRDLAEPLPALTMATLMNLPDADGPAMRAWTGAISRALDPYAPAVVRRAGDAAVREAGAYLAPEIAARRGQPSDDLLSALVGDSGSEPREAREAQAMAVMLLFTGNETTTNWIGNGTLALLRHPQQWRVLQERPAIRAAGLEELLRYDSPVQMTTRVVAEPAVVRGKRMRPGQTVVAMVGAANRDPARFPDPDRLDVQRRGPSHLAFGAGAHFCLGAPLARLEARIAFSALLRRFPALQLRTEPQWQRTLVMRGLRSLEVQAAAGPRTPPP